MSLKLKPRGLIWGAGIAFVLWNVIKSKVGGDCGCHGGRAASGEGTFRTTQGSTQATR